MSLTLKKKSSTHNIFPFIHSSTHECSEELTMWARPCVRHWDTVGNKTEIVSALREFIVLWGRQTLKYDGKNNYYNCDTWYPEKYSYYKHWLPNTETSSSSSSFIMHLLCAKYFTSLISKIQTNLGKEQSRYYYFKKIMENSLFSMYNLDCLLRRPFVLQAAWCIWEWKFGTGTKES